MSDDDVPDDWDDIPYDAITVKAKRNGNRPVMDQEAENARRLWIKAIRAFHMQQSGEPSTYSSNPRWDGGLCKNTNRTYKPVWPKVVAHAAENGLTVLDLLRALFEYRVDIDAPNAYEITSAANTAAAKRRKQYKVEAIKNGLRTEESIYRSARWAAGMRHPDPDVATKDVLNDLSRDMSPLFRYSVAYIRGYGDVADRWYAAALHQLQQDLDAYLEHWPALVPAHLVAAAESVAR